jgi:hypothetical protein
LKLIPSELRKEKTRAKKREKRAFFSPSEVCPFSEPPPPPYSVLLHLRGYLIHKYTLVLIMTINEFYR